MAPAPSEAPKAQPARLSRRRVFCQCIGVVVVTLLITGYTVASIRRLQGWKPKDAKGPMNYKSPTATDKRAAMDFSDDDIVIVRSNAASDAADDPLEANETDTSEDSIDDSEPSGLAKVWDMFAFPELAALAEEAGTSLLHRLISSQQNNDDDSNAQASASRESNKTLHSMNMKPKTNKTSHAVVRPPSSSMDDLNDDIEDGAMYGDEAGVHLTRKEQQQKSLCERDAKYLHMLDAREKLPTWFHALIEALLMAKHLQRTLVLPCVAGGLVVPCTPGSVTPVPESPESTDHPISAFDDPLHVHAFSEHCPRDRHGAKPPAAAPPAAPQQRRQRGHGGRHRGRKLLQEPPIDAKRDAITNATAALGSGSMGEGDDGNDDVGVIQDGPVDLEPSRGRAYPASLYVSLSELRSRYYSKIISFDEWLQCMALEQREREQRQQAQLSARQHVIDFQRQQAQELKRYEQKRRHQLVGALDDDKTSPSLASRTAKPASAGAAAAARGRSLLEVPRAPIMRGKSAGVKGEAVALPQVSAQPLGPAPSPAPLTELHLQYRPGGYIRLQLELAYCIGPDVHCGATRVGRFNFRNTWTPSAGIVPSGSAATKLFEATTTTSGAAGRALASSAAAAASSTAAHIWRHHRRAFESDGRRNVFLFNVFHGFWRPPGSYDVGSPLLFNQIHQQAVTSWVLSKLEAPSPFQYAVFHWRRGAGLGFKELQRCTQRLKSYAGPVISAVRTSRYGSAVLLADIGAPERPCGGSGDPALPPDQRASLLKTLGSASLVKYDSDHASLDGGVLALREYLLALNARWYVTCYGDESPVCKPCFSDRARGIGAILAARKASGRVSFKRWFGLTPSSVLAVNAMAMAPEAAMHPSAIANGAAEAPG